jgi:hypothetical protein
MNLVENGLWEPTMGKGFALASGDTTGETFVVYLDESMQGTMVVTAAILIPASVWNKALDHQVATRKLLRHARGVFVSKEIHASEFVSGRGRYSKFGESKADRADIFKTLLDRHALIPGMRLFCVVCENKKQQNWGFERLLNRIQRYCEPLNGTFILAPDIGFDWLYTKLSRKLRRYNPVPNSGNLGYTSLPVYRLIEDPLFLDSKKSFFIQSADAIAYALLRNERPRSDDPFGIDQYFKNTMADVMVKEANRKDPLGIIRVP